MPSPFDSVHTIPADKAAEPAVTSRPLATVYFTLNSSRLRPAEKRRLREAVAAGINSEVVVRIEGHTCRIGTAAYNRKLSRGRAHVVSSYLKSLGVPIREVIGLGKAHPLGGPLSKDRRAEIIIRERNYIP
jgi:outer membrane protein OmpA-like peptidoglycan-associated protein